MTILANNFDDKGKVINSKYLDRIDWVVEVNVDMDKVTNVSNSNGQDVYLYEGNVNLDNCQYRIYKNPKTQDKDLATPFSPLPEETVCNLAKD